jgi:hypothetical protein
MLRHQIGVEMLTAKRMYSLDLSYHTKRKQAAKAVSTYNRSIILLNHILHNVRYTNQFVNRVPFQKKTKRQPGILLAIFEK